MSDSDSEHERSRAQPPENDGPSGDANRMSTLATTKVCLKAYFFLTFGRSDTCLCPY